MNRGPYRRDGKGRFTFGRNSGAIGLMRAFKTGRQVARVRKKIGQASAAQMPGLMIRLRHLQGRADMGRRTGPRQIPGSRRR